MATMGSKKYPMDLESGHSWVTGPPLITPGFTRTEVPKKKFYQCTEGRKYKRETYRYTISQ